MIRHVAADLAVHTNDELARFLGAEVRARTQLRVWPLSSVELLELESGERWVYKTQRLLDVEPRFYATVGDHPLLPRCREVGRSDSWSALLLEHLDPPLHVSADPAEIVSAARAVVEAIAALPADAPVYVDISSKDKWQAVVDWTLTGLASLNADRRFTQVDHSAVDFVSQWATTPSVIEAVEATSRVTNGDMKFDHVFVGDGGLSIVDWAVPAMAPADIDLVMLLEDAGLSPLAHVSSAIVGVRWFLMLRWAVEAKLNLIPSMPRLFDDWAASAIAAIREAAKAERR